MGYGAQKMDRPATYADLEALPVCVEGEIIDGTLYTHPHPAPVHSFVRTRLIGDLGNHFQNRRGRPTGWWLMWAPGVQAGGSPEFVPDLAGWRRERVPALPSASWTVAPDWACEILTSDTRAYDQCIKRPFYARIGIRHLWFLDLEARILTISELMGGRWVELGVYGDDDIIRAAPFEAVELKFSRLWPPIPDEDTSKSQG